MEMKLAFKAKTTTLVLGTEIEDLLLEEHDTDDDFIYESSSDDDDDDDDDDHSQPPTLQYQQTHVSPVCEIESPSHQDFEETGPPSSLQTNSFPPIYDCNKTLVALAIQRFIAHTFPLGFIVNAPAVVDYAGVADRSTTLLYRAQHPARNGSRQTIPSPDIELRLRTFEPWRTRRAENAEISVIRLRRRTDRDDRSD
ncbi:hypothetical protein EVAR_89983_1 [Eumeta japonica]|uniref:Uncharacterized protein n=1 Tax=Eumeta variegata TaxID=151549 RepID=A0A4C2A8K0_EUMVA|nr:hypothetical protein EVAR_89983_1 [Eumeta japonica]